MRSTFCFSFLVWYDFDTVEETTNYRLQLIDTRNFPHFLNLYSALLSVLVVKKVVEAGGDGGGDISFFRFSTKFLVFSPLKNELP